MSIKRLAGETAIYGISSILPRLLTFVILTPWLTRITSQGQYGVIGDLHFWIALGVAVIGLRFETAVFRYASRKDHAAAVVYRTATLTVLGAVLLTIGPGLLLAPTLADWLSYPDRVVYIQFALGIVAFDVLGAIPLARLRLEGRPRVFAAVQLGNVVLTLLLLYALLEVFPRRPIGGIAYRPDFIIAYYFLANLLASGVRYLVLLLVTRRPPAALDATLDGPNILPAPAFSPALFRLMAAYCLPLMLVTAAGIVNNLIGPSLIKYYQGGTVSANLDVSGQYSAALKLAVVMNLFITAYNYAAEPFFFRQSSQSEDRTIYADSARLFTLVGSIGFIGILVFLDELQLFIGADKREAMVVVPVMLAANLVLGLYYNLSIGFRLTDHTRQAAWVSLIGAAVTIALSIWLTPLYGAFGPAWAMLACYVFMAVAAYALNTRYFPVAYHWCRILTYPALAVGAYFLHLFLLQKLQPAFWVEFVFNIVYLLTFLAVLYVMERRWLRGLG